MLTNEFLAISFGGKRHERALLHGAGGVCQTRARAVQWLQRCVAKGWTCIVHLNYTNLGSDQHNVPAADITIHDATA